MAGYEAEAYAYSEQLKLVEVAYIQIQQSMTDLLKWSKDLNDIVVEKPSDAEKVNDFASYETTWADKWKQLWQR